MKVSEAIATRKTVRAFKSDPVPRETIESILSLAARAPSGGNLQPWKVYALLGPARDELVRRVAEARKQHLMGERPEYHIYPPELTEPYRTRRFRIGEAMYATLGIPREDKAARLKFFSGNWEFFGAPAGLIFTIDRQMQQGQWSDLGMFLENIMLLAREHRAPHLSAGSLGGLAPGHPRIPVRAGKRDDLLRHGDRPCGRRCAGECALQRTRAADRVRHYQDKCLIEIKVRWSAAGSRRAHRHWKGRHRQPRAAGPEWVRVR